MSFGNPHAIVLQLSGFIMERARSACLRSPAGKMLETHPKGNQARRGLMNAFFRLMRKMMNSEAGP